MVKGLVSGSFDLFHIGHAKLLELAKEQCDHLTVAVSSDEHIRRVKGGARPLIPLVHRLELLRDNRHVDRVLNIVGTTDDEVAASLERMVRLYQPQVVFCGLSRTADKNFLPIQRRYGFDYIVIDTKIGESTSGIVERVLTLYRGERSA